MIKMGTIWDRTTEFLRDHLAALMPIVLLSIFASSSVSNALQPLSVNATGATGPIVTLVILVCALASVWGQIAVTAFAIDPAAGASTAMARATRRFLAVILVLLVFVIALALLAAPIGVMLALGGFDFQGAAAGVQPTLAPAYAGMVALYALALLPVFLFLIARLALLMPVLTNEPGWFGAFGRSFALTRGLTWKLIGVIILYLIVSVVVTLAVQAVFGSILYLLQGDNAGAISIASVLTAIVLSAVSTAFTLLSTVFIAKLYVAVTGRQEADTFA